MSYESLINLLNEKFEELNNENIQHKQRISKLVSENTKLQNDLFTQQLNEDEADSLITHLKKENELLKDCVSKQNEEYIELANENKKLKEEKYLLSEYAWILDINGGH